MNKIDIIINVISIIVSGLISWLISFLYYKKGNKDLLHREFIYPFIKELNESNEIRTLNVSRIRKSEYIKILTNKEYKLLDNFLNCLEQIKPYNVNRECCDSIFEYFLQYMEYKDICITHIEFIHDNDGEIVEQEEVFDFEKSVFQEYIIRALCEYPLYACDEFKNEMNDTLNEVLNRFLLEQIGIKEKLEFFEYTDVTRIFKKSTIHKEWLKKFQDFRISKNNLFETRLFKKVMKDYKIDYLNLDYYAHMSEQTFKLNIIPRFL